MIFLLKMYQTTVEDKIKHFENLEMDRSFMKGLPICVRLDGRRFAKKNFKHPYDSISRNAFIETAKNLMYKFHADMS